MMMMMNCFVALLTDEMCLALLPAGIVLRDPRHRESPKRDKQDLNMSSGFVE